MSLSSAHKVSWTVKLVAGYDALVFQAIDNCEEYARIVYGSPGIGMLCGRGGALEENRCDYVQASLISTALLPGWSDSDSKLQINIQKLRAVWLVTEQSSN